MERRRGFIEKSKLLNIKNNMWFQIEVLNKHLFITSKPMIYLINLSEKDYIRKKNKWSVIESHCNDDYVSPLFDNPFMKWMANICHIRDH